MKGIGILGVLLAAVAFGVHPALAHTGGHAAAAGAGFWSGLGHPFGGLDHVLAMVVVGLLAAALGGRALWLVPGAFLATMAAGGLAGMAGWPPPYVELGIAGSVVVLGALVAAAPSARLPALAAALVVGALATFHGHAHGTEAPSAAAVPWLYALGFVLATAALHAAGIGLGLLLGRSGAVASLPLLRLGGGAIAAAGVLLLIV
jgi:urease accessory protein